MSLHHWINSTWGRLLLQTPLLLGVLAHERRRQRGDQACACTAERRCDASNPGRDRGGARLIGERVEVADEGQGLEIVDDASKFNGCKGSDVDGAALKS